MRGWVMGCSADPSPEIGVWAYGLTTSRSGYTSNVTGVPGVPACAKNLGPCAFERCHT